MGGVRRTDRARRAGFTLIEILVVVAIVALLVSIMVPSIAAAREQGRRAVCLSNLHQSGTGFSMYAADFKQYLPSREHFGYYIKGSKQGFTTPQIINYGSLYGKYVGKDLHIFFCPANIEHGYDDPAYGAASFLRPASSITFGGYIWAIPLLPGNYPRESTKGVYPAEGLSPRYVTWADGKPYDPRKRPLQALEADNVIAYAKYGGIGLGEFIHKTGYNVLFTDYHAKWVADPKRIIARIAGGGGPTSGSGGVGSDALFEAWEIFSRQP
ncbi:MAG TPA: prepilin-type N-terminal cleavage/methylation domain-containing protein [Phycisphaerae bacterium]|nr:prepilin-type N-terminal cleavage/methylation domain-containing protein [Phycisphaerae bacterium]